MSLQKSKFSIVLVLCAALISVSLISAAQDQQSSDVVAVVNDEKITSTELSQATQLFRIFYATRQVPKFSQFLMSTKTGQEFLQAYRDHVLDQLIKEKLQFQVAEMMRLEVSEEEINKRVDELINTQIQRRQNIKDLEDLKKKLEEQDMTYSDYRQRVKDQAKVKNTLLKEKLKEKVVGDIQVTEAEITDYYEANKSSFKDQEGEVKPLKELKDQIKSVLKGQKKNEKYQTWLQQVREEAEIEKKLPTSTGLQ